MLELKLGLVCGHNNCLEQSFAGHSSDDIIALKGWLKHNLMTLDCCVPISERLDGNFEIEYIFWKSII